MLIINKNIISLMIESWPGTEEREWQTQASRSLKALMASHGLKYAELVSRLNALGINETYASVANKLSRGTFSHAFFLQCQHAVQLLAAAGRTGEQKT